MTWALMVSIAASLAVLSVVLLITVELLRQVMVLRQSVKPLLGQVGVAALPEVGQVVELGIANGQRDLIVAFMSNQCAFCEELDVALGRLVHKDPELSKTLLIVERERNLDTGEPAQSPARSIQSIEDPELFTSLGINATPTLVLFRRKQWDGPWTVVDAVAGADEGRLAT